MTVVSPIGERLIGQIGRGTLTAIAMLALLLVPTPRPAMAEEAPRPDLSRLCAWDYFTFRSDAMGDRNNDYQALRTQRFMPLYIRYCETAGIEPFGGKEPPPLPPEGLTDAKMKFRNKTFEDLFLGRFDRIRARAHGQWENYERLDDRSKFAIESWALSADFRLIVNLYVGRADKRWGGGPGQWSDAL